MARCARVGVTWFVLVAWWCLSARACDSNPCLNNATCTGTNTDYDCTCVDGYTGTNCETNVDDCASNPCQNKGTCADGVNMYTCSCTSSFTGTNCEDVNECHSNPCLNGGACSDGNNTFTCGCATGYTGMTCDVNINDCDSNPCKNKGICNDLVGQYSCSCVAGYTGSQCGVDIPECMSSPCRNGATCQEEVNMYNCSCAAGYTGVHCETDIDECSSSPCLNNGVCSDSLNGYTCSCATGYTGMMCETNIDECASSPCQNGGICRDGVNMYNCTCAAGFTGATCDANIDECLSNPCLNDASCVDDVNGYSCSCAAGYAGIVCATDVNECSSMPCTNGGTCTDKVNMYTCACIPGYTGLRCEIDVDECSSSPCQNSGTCRDIVNGYSCWCVDGYTGMECQTNIDECASVPCQNGGACMDAVNMYTCVCAAGYTGTHCETDINECASSPCQHGGTCNNMVNSYTCDCVAGYTGMLCETNVDDCSSKPCLNGANCNDEVDMYTCICVAGYSGTHCETDVDECESSPCQHGGTCNDEVNMYTCDCVAGYTGMDCETDIDECSSTPCQFGGTCTDVVNGYTCTCVTGYTGADCETNIDECSSQPCQNGGTCDDEVNMYTCRCEAGWTSHLCESDIDECASNTDNCHANATCTNNNGSFSCGCNAGFSGDGKSCSLLAPMSPVFNVRIVEILSQEVSLSWSDSNPVVDDYLVTYNDDKNQTSSVITSVAVLGLDPFTSYTFTVRARNSAGLSDIGSTSSVSVRTGASEPSPPRSIAVTVIDSSAVNVTWLPPENPNGILGGYDVRYYRNDKGEGSFDLSTVGNESLSHVIRGLQPYTNYSVAVRAFVVADGQNISGQFSSPPAVAETAPEVPDGPPTMVQAVSQSSTSITLTWDQPDLDNRNGRITGYRITYYPKDNSSQVTQEMDIPDVSREVEMLVKYTFYCFKVAARSHFTPTDGRGVYGPDSDAVCEQTQQDVPEGPPLQLVTTAISSTQVRGEWQPPRENLRNGVILAYLIQYRLEGSQSRMNSSEFANASGVVESLDFYSVYCFQVSARTNVTGQNGPWGPFSSEDCTRTLEDRPSPPLNVTAVQVSDDVINVTWQTPARENGIIDTYTVYYSNVNITGSVEFNDTVEGNMTSFLITGLDPFTVYAIQVTASTGAGEGMRSGIVKEQTDESTPDRPTGLGVTDITAVSAILHWLPPDRPNGIVVNYSLEIMASFAASRPHVIREILPAGQRNYTATGLNEFTFYGSSIRAATSKGFGETAMFDTLTTLQAAPVRGPTIFSNTTTANSLTFLWEMLSLDDRNGIITGYKVAVVEVSSDQLVNRTNVTELNFTQSGLNEDTNYNVAVAASTMAGTGPSSAGIIRTDEAAPIGSPSNVATRVLSSRSLFVSWGPILSVDERNGVIRTYTVNISNNETGEVVQSSVTANAEQTNWTFEKLQEYVVYYVQVAGSTLAGTGPFTAPVFNRTLEDVPSGEPQDFVAEVLNFSSIRVMWNPPLQSEQNGIIREYQLNYTSFDGTFNREERLQDFETAFVATGLTPYTQYNFTVIALTSVGSGPPAAVQNTTAQSTPDDAPRDLLATNKTTPNNANASVTLTWMPPSTPNGRISRYDVVIFLAYTNITVVSDMSMTEELFIDSKLDKYTWYEAQVRAVTIAPGPFSRRLRFLTDEDVPERPNEFQLVSRTDTSVTVSWMPPSDSNGIRRGYQLTVTEAHYLLTDPLAQMEAIPLANQQHTAVYSGLLAEDSQLLIINLHPFAQYTLILQARTAKGLGDMAELDVQTLPSSPSGAVQQLTLVAGSESGDRPNMMIRWMPPVVDLRNNIIRAYKVDSGRTDGIDVGSVVYAHSGGPNSEQTQTRPDLDAYKYYTFNVSACSDVAGVDCGPLSSQTERTVQTAPGKPIITMSRPASATSIFIVWRPPNDESVNGVLTGFTIYVSEAEVGITLVQEKDITDVGTRNYTIMNLKNYFKYRVEVSATTVREGPRSTPAEVQTDQFLPGESVLEKPVVRRSGSGEAEVDLTWNRPQPNGIITKYEVFRNGTTTYNDAGQIRVNSDVATKMFESVIGPNVDPVTVTITGLTGNTVYIFKVRASTSIGAGNFSNIQTISTPTTDPPSPLPPSTGVINVKFPDNVATPAITTTTLPAVFRKASELNGAITHYAIIVLEVPTDITALDVNKSTVVSYYEFNLLADASQQKPPFFAFFGTPDELTPVTFTTSRRKRAAGDPEGFYFMLGTTQQAGCSQQQTACNGELTPGTSYRFKIRAFTQVDNNSPLMGVFSDSDYSEPVNTNTSPDDSFPVAAVVVPIILIIVVVCAILAFYFLYWQRRSKLESLEMTNTHTVAKAEMRRPSFIVRNRDAAAGGRPRLHSLHPLRNHPNLSRPVAVSHFAKHVTRMSADTDFKFSEEFETVQGVGLEGTTEASLMDENRPKNRYTNILAYDHSRVKLSFTDDEPGSDYVNSNYIHGYNMPRAFIAAQGPMPNTFDDFWRMVWEQNSSTIVMLTQLQEKGRTKCHKYWPDEEATVYGEIEIVKTSEKSSTHWDVREFSMQYGKQIRTVRQFQFTTWPDMGVPEEPGTIVDFVRWVRAQQVADAGPMVVHCSAGVGRTGTFICIDTVLRRMREKDTVDIFGVVSAMRLQRNHMVQTEAQYIFIHKALLEVIQQMNLDKPSTTPPTAKSDNLYANTGELREQAMGIIGEQELIVEESKM